MEEATKTEIVHKVEHVEKDAHRFGLSGVKGDVVDSHPLQSHLRHSSAKKEAEMKPSVAGCYLWISLPIENAAGRTDSLKRPPGALPSSMLGLEAMTGCLDDFGFDDYLNDPFEREDYKPRNMHHGMEVRLGLSRGLYVPASSEIVSSYRGLLDHAKLNCITFTKKLLPLFS